MQNQTPEVAFDRLCYRKGSAFVLFAQMHVESKLSHLIRWLINGLA